ncbi:Leucine-rich repeat receptor-like protein kinase [Seminavis robusta]|uniref:Leucine-rich repeat receptor-like protein kinase n=1 Tax=Seminavis robusta TaxID=568900 RepID=A0A9N8F148_9STRA|nr:Leucine-rich repeat receptor-like protein kinase [Seminavis robusta]|eukprot:Sro3933_g351940.1 Leucine-rich repeat receptor-like protein kinase (306) ;mRNA; r:1083-2303
MGFSETSLSGTVPSEMGRLQSLESLVIGHSKIGGTVPSELGNLSSLIWLVFESTNFSGSFPSEVFLLSNLRALQVFECPGLKTESVLHGVVRNMHKIERLGLGRGKPGRFISVPTEIARLTNMLSLSLEDFQLNGTLPSEVGLLTKLTRLRLHENAIVGALPTEFLKFSGLNILDIGSNQMEGKLEQSLFSQLTQLDVFSINGNWFSGSLPTEVGLLSSLRKLQLHNTNLSGTLPTELQLMDKLTSLVVMNTSLSGSIPSKLSSAILPPQELKCFGGECYKVATTSLSACHGTRLCGCSCDPCPV